MFKLGDIEVHVINAGQVLVDSGGAFGLVPRILWSRHQTPINDWYLPMSLNCVLIKTGDNNIICDVGHGDKLTDKMRRVFQITYPQGTLQDGLARAGLSVEDIDIVIDTHLHGDHAGGSTTFDEDRSTIVAAFPNAEYVVQQREYEDAMQPNERTRATYYPENYEPLVKSGQMRLLNGDTDIVPGVRVVMMPGHTPAHTGVHIYNGEKHVLFVCDLASYAAHFEKLGWMTAYDVEPLVTLETKRRWQQWALENDPIIIYPHDTTMIASRFRAHEKGEGRNIPVSAEEGAEYI